MGDPLEVEKVAPEWDWPSVRELNEGKDGYGIALLATGRDMGDM